MKVKFNKELMLSLKDNYTKSNDVKKIIDELVYKYQQEFLKNPKFTLTLQLDTKSGKKYITAKSCILFGVVETNQIRVSVGCVDNFKDWRKNPKVSEIAKMKLIKRVNQLINK